MGRHGIPWGECSLWWCNLPAVATVPLLTGTLHRCAVHAAAHLHSPGIPPTGRHSTGVQPFEDVAHLAGDDDLLVALRWEQTQVAQ